LRIRLLSLILRKQNRRTVLSRLDKKIYLEVSGGISRGIRNLMINIMYKLNGFIIE